MKTSYYFVNLMREPRQVHELHRCRGRLLGRENRDQPVEALVGDADQSLVGLGLAAGIGLHLRPGPGDDVEDGRLAAER